MFMSGVSSHSVNGTTFWFEDIPTVKSTTQLWTSKGIDRWAVGSYNTTARADLQAFQAKGKYGFTAILDIEPNQAQVTELREYFRTYAADRGYDLLPNDDYHLVSGDSNGTMGASTDWTSLFGGANAFAPQSNIAFSNTSVGGQGVDELEGVSGRYALKDSVILAAAADGERDVFYHLPLGENDFTAIAASASAWANRYTAIFDLALAIDPKVRAVAYGPPPRPDGGAPYETNRLTAGALLEAWCDASPLRRFYVPFGTSSTLGSRALQISGGGLPYYQSDETHYNATGDAEAFSQVQPIIFDARDTLGIE
jgi:hypothetical protein